MEVLTELALSITLSCCNASVGPTGSPLDNMDTLALALPSEEAPSGVDQAPDLPQPGTVPVVEDKQEPFAASDQPFAADESAEKAPQPEEDADRPSGGEVQADEQEQPAEESPAPEPETTEQPCTRLARTKATELAKAKAAAAKAKAKASTEKKAKEKVETKDPAPKASSSKRSSKKVAKEVEEIEGLKAPDLSSMEA